MKKKCPICGAEMKIDTSAVCMSIPPKFRCVCPSCNCLDFIKTSEYDQYKEEPSLPSNLDEAAEKQGNMVDNYGDPYGGGNGYRIDCGINVSLIIDSVHELQHALRLCGIKKEIVL